MRLAENQCRPSLIRRRFSSSLVERPIKRLGEGTVDRAIERSSVGGILQSIKKPSDRVIECLCGGAIKQSSDGAMKRSSDEAMERSTVGKSSARCVHCKARNLHNSIWSQIIQNDNIYNSNIVNMIIRGRSARSNFTVIIPWQYLPQEGGGG